MISTGFFLPSIAAAVGISVQPARLELYYPGLNQKAIVVKNISAEPVSLNIYVDDFKDQVAIEPSELSLLPGQASPVQVKVDFSGQPAGAENTNLSVVASALDKRSFNAASGIKVPLTIIVRESFWAKPIILLVLGVFLVLLFMILWLICKDPKAWIQKDSLNSNQ